MTKPTEIPLMDIVKRLRDLAPHLSGFEDGDTGLLTNDDELVLQAADAIERLCQHRIAQAIDKAMRNPRALPPAGLEARHQMYCLMCNSAVRENGTCECNDGEP